MLCAASVAMVLIRLGTKFLSYPTSTAVGYHRGASHSSSSSVFLAGACCFGRACFSCGSGPETTDDQAPHPRRRCRSRRPSSRRRARDGGRRRWSGDRRAAAPGSVTVNSPASAPAAIMVWSCSIRPVTCSTATSRVRRPAPGRCRTVPVPRRRRPAFAATSTVSQNTPCPQGIRVASATHSRSGARAVKSRCTRSGAGDARGFCLVEPVRQRLRRNAPCSPASRISRSTRFRDTLSATNSCS